MVYKRYLSPSTSLVSLHDIIFYVKYIGITPESTIHKETCQIIDDALEALLKQTEKM
jgi:hypothetical protein